ncbi:unnamed protein product [Effrenium voratum]|nr:unnamed protein product [Effrenium voratum]
MEGRQGPYDRVPVAMSSPPSDVCPFCRWPLDRWVQIRLGKKRCHVLCLAQSSQSSKEKAAARELLERSPGLEKKRPAARISGEEERTTQAGASGKAPDWPFQSLPPAPVAIFHLEGVLEIRISSSGLTSLPPEIGQARQLETLCLISNHLSTLPAEVGRLANLVHLYLNGNFITTLPEEVCRLPALTEICLDANLLEQVPPFTSEKLVLYTAPANKLLELGFNPSLERLEVHGNQLRSLQDWTWKSCCNLVTLKVMGNQLTELPEEVAQMPQLRILSVASNRLRCLPKRLSELQRLEWILAYENCLTDLPENLAPGCRGLRRLLLESNPLQPSAVVTLIADLARSEVKTLGLDLRQVKEAAVAGGLDPVLPEAVSVGEMLPMLNCQIVMKLTRASQLRRAPGRATEPPQSAAGRSPLLVVAFAASQAEPEWLGFLRRLHELGEVSPFAPPTEWVEADDEDFDTRISRFWAYAPCQLDEVVQEEWDRPSLPLADFDVLTVVDHRMRWYNEDRPAVEAALRQLRPRYEKMLFVGASMGGFGALLHGGRLADAVLAFNPQTTLTEALLRPPAEKPADLQDLSQAVIDSVKAADGKAQITVHSAADEHLLHACALGSGITLVVHPLQPRKPFARILDRAGLLLPIVSEALFRLLTNSGTCGVSVGCWQRGGSLKCMRAEPGQLLRIFFGPGSSMMPRAGDWFCGLCRARNCTDRFFCWRCSQHGVFEGAVTLPGTLRVMDSFSYPSKWDWGCQKCGAALCGYQYSCSNCGTERPAAG